jgi:chromate transporter
VLLVFLRLGLTSFGGPVAHLGYFHHELVERRKWLDEQDYADLVALCQFLPGPASSQVGIGLGVARAGLPGAFAAWLGFTLPSALLLVLFAWTIGTPAGATQGWLQGLKVVAVAVVAQAVWGMARKLTPDAPRVTLALAAAAAALLWPGSLVQLLSIVLAGVIGWRFLRHFPARHAAPARPAGSRRTGALLLGVFALLLVTLPLLREATGSFPVAVFDSFYRAGSLVFGGGHVVLPLLQAEVVPAGWVSDALFTAGYGAAQAVPGPLFTFAAFLGAVMQPGLAGFGTALLALIAVFLPSFLLLLGVLPFWEQLRGFGAVRAALRGVNAAVVGILLAALWQPVWTSAIFSVADLLLAAAAFTALGFRWPAWLVVLLTALAAALLQLAGVSGGMLR